MRTVNRILITFTILLANLGATLLWLTRDVTLKSQSAYWNQSNVIWYITMHGGIILTFFLLNSMISKRWLYGLVAFFSIFTLMFDLGTSIPAHNIFTALLFGTAVTSILVYGNKQFFTYYITLCSTAGISFLSGLMGWFGFSGIFLGEWIAEVCISICVLLEIWNYKKES